MCCKLFIDNLRSCPQGPRRFRSSLSTSNIPARRKSDVASKNTCENTCLYKSRGTSRPYPKDPYGSAKAKKTATCTVQALRNVPLTEFVSFWLAQQVVNTYALSGRVGKFLHTFKSLSLRARAYLYIRVLVRHHYQLLFT